MKPTRVLIGTPLKGEVTPAYAKTLVEMMSGELPGVEFGHLFMSGTCVFGARDRLAYEAEKGGFNKLIFWDADLKPTPADFVRLLSHDEEFVCGAYGKREAQTHWHFFPFTEQEEILPSGLWRMNQAAIGFSVIDLAVFQRIRARYPEQTYKNKEQGADLIQLYQYFPWQIVGPNTPREKLARLKILLDGKLQHAFNATEMLRQIMEVVDGEDFSTNLMQGEDYGFCRLARETGTRIWLDSKLVIPHSGLCDFPIAHDDLIRMTTEPWRQEHWAKLKLQRVREMAAAGEPLIKTD